MGRIKLFFRGLKFLYQKMAKGFSDEELWDLHHFIAEWILPRLTAFRNLDRMGFPGGLYGKDFGGEGTDEKYEKADKEWGKILDKMIWSFEYVLWDDSLDDKLGRKLGIGTFSEYMKRERKNEKDVHLEKYEEGMRLFSEYFMDLWD